MLSHKKRRFQCWPQLTSASFSSLDSIIGTRPPRFLQICLAGSNEALLLSERRYCFSFRPKASSVQPSESVMLNAVESVWF